MPALARDRTEVLLSFKKALSSLTRLVKKVEEGEYCIDVMQQNLAVIGLLKAAHQRLMDNHLHTCFLEAVDTSDIEKQEKMIEEILKVTKFSQR